jgi:ATPase subunit of ABC transporter with duplicated ATPase domains
MLPSAPRATRSFPTRPLPAPVTLAAQDLAARRGDAGLWRGVAFALAAGEALLVRGPNGSGKTTLLRAIAGISELDGVTARRHGAFGYLPQRLDILDDALTVVANTRAAAPAASVNEVRAGLARFLFRGARADQVAGGLSGGERFRAVLAALLLAQPPPQLLLLDEPTNNLDIASVRQLSTALSCYRGALAVASHDVPFLRSIGITRWLRLDREGRLTAIDPLA